jgi:hypothetical protein
VEEIVFSKVRGIMMSVCLRDIFAKPEFNLGANNGKKVET